MFCYKCGNQVNQTDAFCERCGTPLAAMTGAPAKRAAGKMPLYAKVIIIVAAAAIVAGGAFLLWPKEPGPDVPNSISDGNRGADGSESPEIGTGEDSSPPPDAGSGAENSLSPDIGSGAENSPSPDAGSGEDSSPPPATDTGAAMPSPPEPPDTAPPTEQGNDREPDDPQPSELPPLPDWFTFASGVGAWFTDVRIYPDNTFIGYHQDVDMGDDGPGYEGGTMYRCYFDGKFTDIVKISDYEYSMRVEYLNVEPQEEEYEEGFRILPSEPYGFDDADEFRLYLPGRDTGDLPEQFLWWIAAPMAWEEIPEKLPFYGLYNVGGEQGYIG